MLIGMRGIELALSMVHGTLALRILDDAGILVLIVIIPIQYLVQIPRWSHDSLIRIMMSSRSLNGTISLEEPRSLRESSLRDVDL